MQNPDNNILQKVFQNPNVTLKVLPHGIHSSAIVQHRHRLPDHQPLANTAHYKVFYLLTCLLDLWRKTQVGSHT